MPVRMKIMSDQKMREAFNSLIAKGHMIGFNDFQTGWEAREAIAQGDEQEPVGYVDSHVVLMLRAGTGYSSTIRSLRACEHERPSLDSMTALYTAAPSREVQEDIAKDAERYRWLKQQLIGASFDWDDEGMTVLAFEMPDGLAVGADCDRNIDAARALLASKGGA